MAFGALGYGACCCDVLSLNFATRDQTIKVYNNINKLVTMAEKKWVERDAEGIRHCIDIVREMDEKTKAVRMVVQSNLEKQEERIADSDNMTLQISFESYAAISAYVDVLLVEAHHEISNLASRYIDGNNKRLKAYSEQLKMAEQGELFSSTLEALESMHQVGSNLSLAEKVLFETRVSSFELVLEQFESSLKPTTKYTAWRNTVISLGSSAVEPHVGLIVAFVQAMRGHDRENEDKKLVQQASELLNRFDELEQPYVVLGLFLTIWKADYVSENSVAEVMSDDFFPQMIDCFSSGLIEFSSSASKEG